MPSPLGRRRREPTAAVTSPSPARFIAGELGAGREGRGLGRPSWVPAEAAPVGKVGPGTAPRRSSPPSGPCSPPGARAALLGWALRNGQRRASWAALVRTQPCLSRPCPQPVRERFLEDNAHPVPGPHGRCVSASQRAAPEDRAASAFPF